MASMSLPCPTKQAFVYVRVSSERQAAEDRVSIEVQERLCREYCAEHGYMVAAVFCDKEKYRNAKGMLVRPSGAAADRPAYRELIARATAGECDVIVAWKEDRLYRGMYAAVPFSALLDERGSVLTIELVQETFDRKMLGIKAALGKIELDNIRERMLMGRRERLARGEVPGGNQMRYGYTKLDKKLVIVESEAEIVRLIFHWYIAGAKVYNIRKQLYAQGFLSRMGGYFAKATLTKILSEPAYVTGVLTTDLEGERFEIACPAIVTPGLWQLAAEMRVRNTTAPRNVKTDYLVAGIVYCACGLKCRAVSISANISRGYTKRSGSYLCPRHATRPETDVPICVRQTGSQWVDDQVWADVRALCEGSESINQWLDARRAHSLAAVAAIEAEAMRLSHELARLEGERQRVITFARKGYLTEADLAQQLRALDDEEHGYRRHLSEQQHAQTAAEGTQTMAAHLQRTASDFRAAIALLDVATTALSTDAADAMYSQLEAWKFENKAPGNRAEQLRWAVLEEKRRIVRTFVSRVVLSHAGGSGRGCRKARTIFGLLSGPVFSNQDPQI